MIAAQLTDITFHDLRHYYISHIVNTGLPKPITKQLGGHGSDRAHEIYTYPIPGTEEQTRAALNEAFALPKLESPASHPGSTPVAPSTETTETKAAR